MTIAPWLCLLCLQLPEAPFLTVQVSEPDRQLVEVLHLFDGLKAPSPASALARWKLAHPGQGLSKAAEAGIAALNPEMVPELKQLEGAWFAFRSRDKGAVDWWGCHPRR